MRKELFYTITEENEGQTVGSFLEGQGYSHNLLQSLQRSGKSLALAAGTSAPASKASAPASNASSSASNASAPASEAPAPASEAPAPGGEAISVKRLLSAGEVLRVTLPEAKSDAWIKPQEIPLSIIYEDDDLLVINKDAGVLVHPTQAHPDGTLANGLRRYFDQKGEPFTFRVVNRLDRDTSGLLIVPRHALSAGILGKALADREIRREYLAAATGDLRDVFPDGEGVIDAPIATIPGQSLLREVNFEQGDEARTRVRVLEYNAKLDVTLCAVTLDTGRTHQIRVHFKYIGHPLPGDFLYNPDYGLINRQALHASRLSFAHPITGEGLSFTAPVPDDMRIFLV